MQFNDLMHVLLSLKTEFPAMEWETVTAEAAEDTLVIRLPIPQEHANLLNDGRALFS